MEDGEPNTARRSNSARVARGIQFRRGMWILSIWYCIGSQLLTPAQDARADMLFLTQSQLFETLPNPFPSFIDT